MKGCAGVGVVQQFIGWLMLAGLAIGPSPAEATRLSAATPSGEIARVRQVVLQFSDPVVPMGDPSAAAPATLACTDRLEAKATARWQDDRKFTFDFERELPAGVRCTVTLWPDLRDVAGKPIDGRREFSFSTGGPMVVRSNPWGGQIEEQQHFQLVLNGPVDFESVERQGYCEAKGINERIPLRIVQRDPLAAGATAAATGAQSGARSGAQSGAQTVPTGQSVTVRCQRPLPADAPVAVVWAKGILGTTGVARSTDQRLFFRTRPLFTASFSCDRPQANAPCSPLSVLRVQFSAPIARAMAQAVMLRGPKGPIAPKLPDNEELISSVEFAPAHPERTELGIELPAGLKDESGRPLANASLFPLKIAIGDLPPLAKFPAAPFGIIELNDDATLPITLRNVEADLNVRAYATGQPGAQTGQTAGQQTPGQSTSRGSTASTLRIATEVQVLDWLKKLGEFHERSIETGRDAKKQPVYTPARTLSLLKDADARAGEIRRIALPLITDSKRPFEVVGLPLNDPGFYVVEVESLMLGQALLEKNVPMYVRTGALVTNLAVHFKQGRENAMVWVTSLDRGQPVAGAAVRVTGCDGRSLWQGVTGSDGIALIDVELPRVNNCSEFVSGLLVSARKTDARGRADFSFALSSWNQGIEPWRFNVPTGDDLMQTIRAHTVFDRSLLRAGETVSMKHFMRAEAMQGLKLAPKDRLATHVRIVHQGSNQEFKQAIEWQQGRSAMSTFRIPKEAKLGRYDVYLTRDAGTAAAAQASTDGDSGIGPNDHPSGRFRVEEFRLPVLEGKLIPPKDAQIAVTEVPIDLQMKYLSGGPASDLPVEVSAMLRRKYLNFADYEEYNFNLREARRGPASSQGQDESTGESSGEEDQGRLVADKLPVKLDANGAGRTAIRDLKPATTPRDLTVEATFNDPNGETQTLGNTVTLYPAAVLVGVKTGSWVSVSDKLNIQAVALDTRGKPLADVPIEMRGRMVKRITTRKRLVGGLYGYDTRTEENDLGALCSGKSNDRGEFQCDASVKGAGQMQLVARVTDAKGRAAQADASVWVTQAGEVWFDAENLDRIDLLPEKKRYEPGQTARLQVRMPFRNATALVAIEREGIIDTLVVELSGKDPSINVAIKDVYGPNVFVSVLAVRGRIRGVPWYSLFTWGWRSPGDWWRERQSSRDFNPPNALVDLSKPAFKLGVAELTVGIAAHELKVSVSTDSERYQVRQTARTRIKVTLPDGKPVPAGTEVAVAAVDEALLELQANTSWKLLDAMFQRRSYAVQTATAQMQVVGKRHYGRKALPPGGDGGRAPTRELFDTLLLWKASVLLDAKGEATLDVPLNDSLTSFRIVAVADAGEDLFGTGSTLIRSSQDLQIASGLPPLVRDDDRFTALVILRNATDRAMSVRFSARSSVASHEATADIAAHEAREISWPVEVPATGLQVLAWEFSAQEVDVRGGRAGTPDGGGSGEVRDGRDAGNEKDRRALASDRADPRLVRVRATDRVKIQQKVIAAVPVTVQQSTIAQLDGPLELPVLAPPGNIDGRGGVTVFLQPQLSEGLPGVRRYFQQYPFICLEQKTSKSIGLRDVALWQTVVEQMPSYLDDDGLADYFPPYAGNPGRGSDTLTAYLLSVTDEAARLDPRFAIPKDIRDKMERGLIAFVEGRIKRDFWSPTRDSTARKLAALEALSRSGKVRPAMLESIELDPNQWPTGAVLDWYAVLLRTADLPRRDPRLATAEQVLRARLSYQGTRLGWASEDNDSWWWLMANADVNSAKLLAIAIEAPQWQADVPRIALGLLGRFRNGHWLTTNANLLGSLAIDNFSRRFESAAVTGYSAAVLRDPAGGEQARAFDWSRPAGAIELNWPSRAASGMPPRPSVVALAHDGDGKPWATVQMLAAIPVTAPVAAGFKVEKTIEPVRSRTAGSYSRGDVLRVRLKITPRAQATWVVVNDPIPAGATILGSGLGRDSKIEARPGAGNRARGWNEPWVAYEERSFESYRAYYSYVAAGPFVIEYSVRLNNPGEFKLPATRVEAMYNPEMFGALPNTALTVQP